MATTNVETIKINFTYSKTALTNLDKKLDQLKIKAASITLGAPGANGLAGQFTNLTNGATRATRSLSGLRTGAASINNVAAAAKTASSNAFSMGNMFATAGKKFAIWMGATTLFFGAVKALKFGIDTIVAYDTAFTDLMRVTDLTNTSFEAFRVRAAEVAKETGGTSIEATNAAVGFARMGETIENSLELSKSALVLANLGDGITDVAESSQILISVMKGFGFTAQEVTRVMDAMNEVSNKYAVSTGDLATGIQRAAATLNQGGSSLEETLALLTASNEILQDMSKSSTGLITISQRLRGVKEGFDEAEKSVEIIAKMQGALASIGVDNVDSNGELRSTYDILLDISKVWPTLTSMQQQNISTLAAGTHQVKVFNSMMMNSAVITEAVAVGMNSEGSAMRANQILMDSIQGKTRQLTESFQTLWMNTISSDTIKGLVDLTNGFVKLVDVIGLLNIFIGTLVGVSLVKFGASLFMQVSTVQNLTVSLAAATNVMNVFGAQALQGSAVATAAFKSTTIAVAELNTGLAMSKARFIGLAKGFVVFAAAAAVILVPIALAKKFNEEIQDAKDAVKELSEENQKTISTKDSIEPLIKKYAELSKQTELTTEEFKTMRDLKVQILDVYPEFLNSLDKEGKLLFDSNTAAFIANDLLEKKIKAQRQEIANQALLILQKRQQSKQPFVQYVSNAYDASKYGTDPVVEHVRQNAKEGKDYAKAAIDTIENVSDATKSRMGLLMSSEAYNFAAASESAEEYAQKQIEIAKIMSGDVYQAQEKAYESLVKGRMDGTVSAEELEVGAKKLGETFKELTKDVLKFDDLGVFLNGITSAGILGILPEDVIKIKKGLGGLPPVLKTIKDAIVEFAATGEITSSTLEDLEAQFNLADVAMGKNSDTFITLAKQYGLSAEEINEVQKMFTNQTIDETKKRILAYNEEITALSNLLNNPLIPDYAKASISNSLAGKKGDLEKSLADLEKLRTQSAKLGEFGKKEKTTKEIEQAGQFYDILKKIAEAEYGLKIAEGTDKEAEAIKKLIALQKVYVTQMQAQLKVETARVTLKNGIGSEAERKAFDEMNRLDAEIKSTNLNIISLNKSYEDLINGGLGRFYAILAKIDASKYKMTLVAGTNSETSAIQEQIVLLGDYNTQIQARVNAIDKLIDRKNGLSKAEVELINEQDELRKSMQSNTLEILGYAGSIRELTKAKEDELKVKFDTISEVEDKIIEMLKKNYEDDFDAFKKNIDKKRSEIEKFYETAADEKQLKKMRDDEAKLVKSINVLKMRNDVEAKGMIIDAEKNLAEKRDEISEYHTEREKQAQLDNLDTQLAAKQDYYDGVTREDKLYIESRQKLIDGTMTDLIGSYTTFEDRFGQGMSYLGEKIKSDFIDKITAAKQAIMELNAQGITPGSVASASKTTASKYSNVYGMNDTDFNAYVANMELWNKPGATANEKKSANISNIALRTKYGVKPGDSDYLSGKKMNNPDYVGSFAVGSTNIPKNGMALVHEGEAIIPKSMNPFSGNIGKFLSSVFPVNNKGSMSESNSSFGGNSYEIAINVSGSITEENMGKLRNTIFGVISEKETADTYRSKKLIKKSGVGR